jgi:uncharacterized RDD family membrane protein YckC
MPPEFYKLINLLVLISIIPVNIGVYFWSKRRNKNISFLPTESAPYYNRIFAGLFDCALILGLFALYFQGIKEIKGIDFGSALNQHSSLFAVFIIYNIYFSIFESSKLQATPGKCLLNIQVVNEKREKITFSRALARTILSSISDMSYNLLIFFTKYRQGIHEITTNTVVVTKSNTNIKKIA